MRCSVERGRDVEVRKMMATAIIGAIALGYLCIGFRRLLQSIGSDPG